MDAPDASPSPPAGRKLAIVAGLIALTVGLSGFFMGLRQTHRAAFEVRENLAITAAPGETPGSSVLDAPRYAELHTGKLHPNRDWKVHLAALSRPAPAAQYVPATLSVDDRARWRATRTQRRQYDGAPPVAPHPTDQITPASCLECHGRPTTISGIHVPQVSHPRYLNCIQCHVSSVGPASWWKTADTAPSDGNSFAGKPQSGQGTRAYVGAPPTVPHTTWMRDDCMSCHGPGGTAALRTSHPDRRSCVQCHALDAALDQRLVSGLPQPPPLAEWKTINAAR